MNAGRRSVRIALVWVPALIGFYSIAWLGSGAKTPAASTSVQAAKAKRHPLLLAKADTKPLPPGSGVNFAAAEKGATATGGSNTQELIDGNDSVYTGGTGFATTTWGATPPQCFLITLKEPQTIDCLRFLLWDKEDERYYRYTLDISPDDKGQAWLLIADRSGPDQQCRSWQTVRFTPQKVKQIRLTGTYNSSNSGFHVVELQASLGMPAGAGPGSLEGLDF